MSIDTKSKLIEQMPTSDDRRLHWNITSTGSMRGQYSITINGANVRVTSRAAESAIASGELKQVCNTWNHCSYRMAPQKAAELNAVAAQ